MQCMIRAAALVSAFTLRVTAHLTIHPSRWLKQALGLVFFRASSTRQMPRKLHIYYIQVYLYILSYVSPSRRLGRRSITGIIHPYEGVGAYDTSHTAVHISTHIESWTSAWLHTHDLQSQDTAHWLPQTNNLPDAKAHRSRYFMTLPNPWFRDFNSSTITIARTTSRYHHRLPTSTLV